MRIGFIGLGIMGEPMCASIIRRSGHEVVVFDICREKMQALAALGAEMADSAAQVGATCDIIITMVPSGNDVRRVFEELLPGVRKGSILVDMSTIEPSVSMELAGKVEARGASMLDAPVVKSKAAAVTGELGIYVGGSRETFEKAKPILACMGSNIMHMGKQGNGLVMKICHNMLVAQIQNGVNEMLLLAGAAGIDVNSAATAVAYGGGQNFYLDSKRVAIEASDFSPHFTVKNMDKDINIAVALARGLGLHLQGAEAVRRVYEEAMAEGHGNLDFSITLKTVERVATRCSACPSVRLA